MQECHDFYMDSVDAVSDSGIGDVRFVFNTGRYVVAPTYRKMALYIEQTFECMGVCTPHLFFYSLPLSKGAPKHTCPEVAFKHITPYAVRIGVAVLILGLVLLFVCKSTLFFWCRYKKEILKSNDARENIEIKIEVR